MTFILGRRKFLQAAAIAAFSASIKGQSPARRPPYPFVDGLCLDLPDDSVIRASELSGYMLDVSAHEEIKTADGDTKWIRSFGGTLKKMNSVRDELRKRPVAFLAADGRE